MEKIDHKRRAREMWTKFFQSMASSYILFVQSILRDQDGKNQVTGDVMNR